MEKENFNNSKRNDTTSNETSTNSNSNSKNSNYINTFKIEILNLEIIGSLFLIASYIYYLKAALVGREIVLEEMSGKTSTLDSNIYLTQGEIYLLIGAVFYTVASFQRVTEKIEENTSEENLKPYRYISYSFVVSSLSIINRIKLRKETLTNIPTL